MIPLAMLLAGCGSKEPQVRQYVEYVEEPESTPATQQAGLPGGHPDISREGHFEGDGHDHSSHDHPSTAKIDRAVSGAAQLPFEKPALQWDVPEGWTLEPGGNAMRLATFNVAKDGAEATTTIVALGGAAGGLQSNLSRWLGQLGVSPDATKLSSFISSLPEFTTAAGDKGFLADLSSWVAADAESMLAGIISKGDQTVFVKMTGPAPLLAEQKTSFETLCGSLR